MEKLILENISFDGFVGYDLLKKSHEVVDDFSCELSFGKCYCFDTELTKGGWGLSWILMGEVNSNSGKILYNDNILTQKELRSLSQGVGLDVNDHFFFGKKTIEKQMKKGLKLTSCKNANSIAELVEIFKLSKEKIDRLITHVSAMRYKASMAIGYAFDKKIFCLPWIDQEWILTFKDLWLKELVQVLKSKGALIVIPTKYSEGIRDLVDDIITV